MMTDAGGMELFSARVCPFAHRTRLVLHEKGIDCALTEIDFDDKPERFLRLSPYGKVPVLVHGDRALYESAVINEYLDEAFPDPPLMPEDPWLRAQARIWIDYCDHHFLDSYYGALTSKDAATQEAESARIVEHLRFVETEGLARLSGDGPYWLGASATLVDFAYYPFFERLPVWAHYRGIEIPESCTRLRAWMDAMGRRASSTALANPPEYYVERYKGYAA